MKSQISPLRLVPSLHQELNVKTVDVLGLSVAALRRTELTQLLDRTLQHDTRGWMSYVNIRAVNLANEIPWFKVFLNESIVAYCDGMGVRLGAMFLRERIPERIVMTDWLLDVCELAQRTGRIIYFLGSTKSIVSKTVLVLRNLFPNLAVGGYHNGYVDSSEISRVISDINSSGAEILVVGMGMPLQERWILDHWGDLNVKIALNAGSCFDYIAGAKKRCPRFVGNLGLEWLYRLIQEPLRLWRRYLIGNPKFVLLCLREAFRRSSQRIG